MPRSPLARKLMDFSHHVHLMLKKVPGALEGDGDLVAVQLEISAGMPGPKYGGIVRGLDRGHVLDRLELCTGNLQEALYWLEFVQGYWPKMAEEAKSLIPEGRELLEIVQRQKRVFDLGLHELDGEQMPWAPYDFDSDEDEDEELDDWDFEDSGVEPD